MILLKARLLLSQHLQSTRLIKRVLAAWARPYSTDDKSSPDDPTEFDIEKAMSRPDMDTHMDMIKRYQLVACGIQSVFIVQPYHKTRNLEIPMDITVPYENAPNYRLFESVGLIETLGWEVAGSMLMPLTAVKKGSFLEYFQIEKVKEELRGKTVTAIFISTYRLRAQQRITLECDLGFPVFDRYNIVLQIFKLHAKTKEAKLQVSLAEIPYMKARLRDDLYFENLNKSSPNRLGAEHFERMEMQLKRRERVLKREIELLKRQRGILKVNRKRLNFPTVAVVGYTNSGKTSLIRALTGREKLQPRDQLFATLDVTVHEMYLPCNLKILLTDTVGFISDIPTLLIGSFSATLEDVNEADVLLHVRDMSNPDNEHQEANVLETLKRLQISHKLLDNMVVVGNKIDKIEASEWKDRFGNANFLPISASKGYGLQQLQKNLENSIIKSTGRKYITIRARTGSAEYTWLHSHTAIATEEVDENDQNYCKLKAVIAPWQLEQFKKVFQLQRSES